MTMTDIAVVLRQVDRADLGARVRALRLARGMTQGQLARGDISVAYVSRIESGTRRPELSTLSLIAERLGTTAEHLLTGTDPERATELRLALRYAELALESGEAHEAERASAQLLVDEQVMRIREIAVDASLVHARALEVLGRLDEAVVELERFRAAYERDGRWPAAAIVLSRCYREAGDFTRAIEVGEQTLATLRDRGLDGLDEAVQLELTVAAAYFERGDQMHAVVLCRDAADRAEALCSPDLRASAYWNVSVIESRRGRHADAIVLAERALALMSEGREARNLARLRLQLGTMMLRASEPDARGAERHIRRARRELAAGSGSAVDLARCDVHLALARLDQNDPDAAETLAQAVLDAAGQTALLAAEAHTVLGRVAAARGERAGTRGHYGAAAAALTAAGADREAAQAWYELAALLDASGDLHAARDAYRSAAAATGLRTPAQLHAAVSG